MFKSWRFVRFQPIVLSDSEAPEVPTSTDPTYLTSAYITERVMKAIPEADIIAAFNHFGELCDTTHAIHKRDEFDTPCLLHIAVFRANNGGPAIYVWEAGAKWRAALSIELSALEHDLIS